MESSLQVDVADIQYDTHSPSAVIVDEVIASLPSMYFYDEDDYYRNYDEYVATLAALK